MLYLGCIQKCLNYTTYLASGKNCLFCTTTTTTNECSRLSIETVKSADKQNSHFSLKNCKSSDICKALTQNMHMNADSKNCGNVWVFCFLGLLNVKDLLINLTSKKIHFIIRLKEPIVIKSRCTCSSIMVTDAVEICAGGAQFTSTTLTGGVFRKFLVSLL